MLSHFAMRAGRATAAALLVVFVSACNSTPSEPDPIWQDNVVFAPSEHVLWTATLQNLYSMGYPVGSEANPATMEIVTAWKTKLAPYRGDGYRLKAEVRYTPTETVPEGKHIGMPGWDVSVRVMRQVNMAIVKPLDPSMAKWEWRPDDPVEAAILLRHILSDFPAGNVLSVPDPIEPTDG